LPFFPSFVLAGPKDVVIFNNTVNFDAHVMQVLPPLATGASLVVVKPKGHLDAGHIVDLVLAHTVTSFVVTVPTLAREYMAEFKRRNLAQYKPMRAWALGGDAMPADLVHQMQEVGRLEMYLFL
jgi:non-ribosomal peptide synthetase component F